MTTITVREICRVSGVETTTFVTDLTVEQIKEQIAEDTEIGVDEVTDSDVAVWLTDNIVYELSEFDAQEVHDREFDGLEVD
jgi:hypothetical protein